MLCMEFMDRFPDIPDDETLFDRAFNIKEFNDMLEMKTYRGIAGQPMQKYTVQLFDTLSMLPYEATSCPESLLQCLIYLAK